VSLVKNFLLILIDYLKKSLLLSSLSDKESKGFISLLSRFHFMPYTKLVVPFSLGRTIRGSSFEKNLTQDPYGRLCMDIFNDVDNKILFKNVLKEFIRERDLTAADIVHLSGNSKLNKYPAWAVVMPWEKISIEEKFEIYPESFYKNRSTKELSFENSSRLSIIETMYSSKSLESKVNQMQKLYKSIKCHGLKKNSNLPKINILIKEKEWRWFMGDAGNHRAYICACFGFKFFESRVSSIINKEEVNRWPNVINGTYSVEEAESIFDSYFDGFLVLRGVV
jgi:hypothetical protein